MLASAIRSDPVAMEELPALRAALPVLEAMHAPADRVGKVAIIAVVTKLSVVHGAGWSNTIREEWVDIVASEIARLAWWYVKDELADMVRKIEFPGKAVKMIADEVDRRSERSRETLSLVKRSLEALDQE